MFNAWRKDKAPRLGAALAYYTAFSIIPILIIAIGIAGLVFGQEAAEGQVVSQIAYLVGTDSAKAIQEMIKNAREPTSGILATSIGLVTLLFGATGMFGELQDALNTVWNTQSKPRNGIINIIRVRFLSFTMVVGIGFLLLVSLIISAGLAALNGFINEIFPGFGYVLQVINFIVSFGFITIMFAMIYRVLPDVKIAWSDVWIGAAVTSLLFSIGKFLIGLYLGRSGIGSAFGAAGSVVIILFWVYYSAQILFFGAEFTQVYADKYGSRRHLKSR